MHDIYMAKLQEFRENISSAGHVSAGDVLSIENAVGSSFITIKNPIGKFTTNHSKVGLGEVIESVDSYISELKQTSDNDKEIVVEVTFSDLTKLQYNVLGRLKALKSTFDSIGTVPDETLNRLLNEKYIWTYYDPSKAERSEVMDLTSDRSILDVLFYNNDYVTGILSTFGYGAEKIDAKTYDINYLITSHFNEMYSENKVMLAAIPTLFVSLLHEDFSGLLWGTPLYHSEYITIRDTVKLLNNHTKVDEQINRAIERVERDIAGNRDSVSWSFDNNYQSLYRSYKQYSNMLKVLDDPVSVTILNVLKVLFK